MTRVLVTAMALVACATCTLSEAPNFGTECDSDRGCQAPLVCRGDNRIATCLPPLPPLPPDTRGSACDAAMPLDVVVSGARAIGEAAYTLTVDNSREQDVPAASHFADGRGFAFFVSFTLPGDADMVARVSLSNAPFKASLVWASGVDSSLDPACTTADRYDVSPALVIGARELVLPRVAPGKHALVVLADVDAPNDFHFTLRVEQVRCPAGYLPDGDGCIGFQVIDGALARVDHSVDFMGDGRAVAVGGTDENDTRLDNAEFLDPRTGTLSSARMFTTRARHGSTTVDDGSVIAIGGHGDTTLGRTSLFTIFRPGQIETSELLDVFSPPFATALDCRIVPLRFPEIGVASCKDTGATIFYGGDPSSFAGRFCNDHFDCGGLTCVAELDNGVPSDEGICRCLDCEDPFNHVDFFDLLAPDDLADREHTVISLDRGNGAFFGVLFVGGFHGVPGGGDDDQLPSRPYVLLPTAANFFHVEPKVEDTLTPRANATGLLLADGVAIAGGTDLSPQREPLATVELFDPLVNEDVVRLELAHARSDTAFVALDDDRAMLIGGSDGDSTLATTEIVDARNRDVLRGPELPFAVRRHRAASDRQGHVVVAGGIDDNGVHVKTWFRLQHIDETLTAPEVLDALVAGDRCNNPIQLTGDSGSHSATSLGYGNDIEVSRHVANDCGSTVISPGPDVVFSFEIPANRALHLELSTTQPVDLSLYVLAECLPTNNTCLAGADSVAAANFGGTSTEALTVAAQSAARAVTIVVDGAGDVLSDIITAGPYEYELTWELRDP